MFDFSLPASAPPEEVAALREEPDGTRPAEQASVQRLEQERTLELTLEQERRRLASELHDTVGQSLTAIYLNTKSLERKLEKSGSGAAGAVSELGEAIHHAVQELHGVMSRLLAGGQPPSGAAGEAGALPTD